MRWNRLWRSAVVVEANLDKYLVSFTTGGPNVSVSRANVKDGAMTPSNSLFRIQKCERSVVLVYGGGTKVFVNTYWGTWRLSPKSTTDKLVWTGGGYGGDGEGMVVMGDMNAETKEALRRSGREARPQDRRMHDMMEGAVPPPS